MGFRFRKSIKIGKSARINLSKSGIGYSVGTKGFRYTQKANGGTRTTTSIPGTGLSYVKETGAKRTTANTYRSAAYTSRNQTQQFAANLTAAIWSGLGSFLVALITITRLVPAGGLTIALFIAVAVSVCVYFALKYNAHLDDTDETSDNN